VGWWWLEGGGVGWVLEFRRDFFLIETYGVNVAPSNIVTPCSHNVLTPSLVDSFVPVLELMSLRYPWFSKNAWATFRRCLSHP
jgi:hypothetical protein